MKLETGYVYHIKNDFFTFANDNKLMTNHEGTATRPNYFCIKREDSSLLWFIPMSSKVCKFKKIIEKKVQNTGRCDTIIIGNYRNRDTANGIAIKVAKKTRKEIITKVNRVFKLKERGIKVIFPDVDRIAQKLLDELAKK